jgi:restriction endonuclease Mrr
LPGARILPGRTVLLIRYGVGVQVKRRIEIVELDEDFFE